MTLSRELLQDEYFQKLALAAHGPNRPAPLSREQIESSMQSTLAARPDPDHLWVFGYGSLVWNPLFTFDERRLVKLHGYRRRFCLRTELSRGTQEAPGLVLGLEPGGSCRGVAFRLGGARQEDDLRLLWRREMVTNAYVPRWLKLHDDRQQTLTGLTFVMNRRYLHYSPGLSLDETAQILATACGPLGSCADYLMNTWHGLQAHGITDHHLKALVQRVAKLGDAASRPSHDPALAARSGRPI